MGPVLKPFRLDFGDGLGNCGASGLGALAPLSPWRLGNAGG